MNDIWENVKNHIKSAMVDKSFFLWINPITLLEERDNTLVLGCPNKFSRNWIMDNYLGIIAKKLKETGYGHYKLSFKVMPLTKKDPAPDIFRESRQLTLPHVKRNGRNIGRGLNDEFTFDRFVVGKCNEFACSVSKSIALGDSDSYNSLFVLANTGLGKSHLSQAIGHAILDRNPEEKVCYITAEDFVNQMIFSLKNNRIEEFKEKYRRNCDVLLLEEVHFLGGKQKTQLELGYTLDVLSNGHKKIIFTSSLLPKDIPNMTKEISSRLTSGIITTIDKPDYMTRVNILEKKASEQNLSLPEDIIHLLAKNLTRDIRQIESALSCLKAKSELLKANITLDLAHESLKCQVSGSGSTSIDDIKKLVCQYFKIEPTMLSSKSRKKIHAYPRNIYSFLCRRYTDETLENIGKSIKRNHSTVLYASEVIEHKMKVEKKVKNQVDFLSSRLEEMTK
ncbi:MAG: chromosomal replication initiator protein DnaA [Thermodesulfobacteriota bacterium]|nr:chromosomal replication initiator protein DnaA [Thermodesulfobacteriota bacterium]